MNDADFRDAVAQMVKNPETFGFNNAPCSMSNEQAWAWVAGAEAVMCKLEEMLKGR